ncbi:hypothetical protein NIES2100_20480 [Calothrix sp. NIES-2100]|nr:hypothetical protein NIES2100_20480 [Calothrix sp. NIES-2100]
MGIGHWALGRDGGYDEMRKKTPQTPLSPHPPSPLTVDFLPSS